MNCSKCGASIGNDSLFCVVCNAEIAAEAGQRNVPVCSCCKMEKEIVETLPCVAYNLDDSSTTTENSGTTITTTTVNTYKDFTPVDVNLCHDCIEKQIEHLERKKRKSKVFMITTILLSLATFIFLFIYQASTERFELPEYLIVINGIMFFIAMAGIGVFRGNAKALRPFMLLKSSIANKGSLSEKEFRDILTSVIFSPIMYPVIRPTGFIYLRTKESFDVWKLKNLSSRVWEAVEEIKKNK